MIPEPTIVTLAKGGCAYDAWGNFVGVYMDDVQVCVQGRAGIRRDAMRELYLRASPEEKQYLRELLERSE